MPILLPFSLLLLQAALLFLLPQQRGPVAYIAMVAAPLLAALALYWRSRREKSRRERKLWWVLALGVLIWSLGAMGNLWHEWIQGRVNEMYREAMLAFQLAGVPVVYLLASEPRSGRRHLVRLIDAVLALGLGYLFFQVTWGMLTARGAPDEAGVHALIWLIDAQNLFLSAGALVRCWVAQDRSERDLFAAVAWYEVAYLLIAGINDHYVAGRPEFGPEHSSVVTLAFALLAWRALKVTKPRAEAAQRPIDLPRQRLVRSASPILIACTLVVVSLVLIRIDYAMGAAGVVLGVVGYGLRSVLTQVRQLERGDTLHRQRVELQTLAWTDALTGVANRHYLDHVLSEATAQADAPPRTLAVLMLDIDHFKRLNDTLGHASGDECLRQVASALRLSLARPGDLLARYGGEEFIALLQGSDVEGAMQVAERARQAVEALAIPHPGSQDGHVTISIGCASGLAGSPAGMHALISAADQALYAAKAAGRNRVAA